jgi:hypothetical protein
VKEDPLVSTHRAIEKTIRRAIDKHREPHKGKIVSYPRAPFSPKATPPQQLQEENLIYMIICFFQIHFPNDV